MIEYMDVKTVKCDPRSPTPDLFSSPSYRRESRMFRSNTSLKKINRMLTSIRSRHNSLGKNSEERNYGSDPEIRDDENSSKVN